jgi:hypothetical protein
MYVQYNIITTDPMYVQSTGQAPLPNHCCRGIAVCIKNSVCVFVALVIKQAKCMRCI